MNRTTRNHAFGSGLVYDDPEYRDAYALIESEGFLPSSFAEERRLLVNQEPVETLLDEYGEAMAAFYPAQEEYTAMQSLCYAKSGYQSNPIIEHMECKIKPVEAAYWHSLRRLSDALEVEVVVCIKEALSLAGVTDTDFMDDICRCVIRGGTLGKGTEQVKRNFAFTPPNIGSADSVICPHCGLPNDPADARCFSCEKMIG